MTAVKVQEVRTKRDQKEFLMLPWQLNENDANWIPPLRQNQKELVGFAKHPFFDDAASQAFIAKKDQLVCGRILALVNHAHNRRHHEQTGFFGFFECVDDQEVADCLFEAAQNWLQQKGMNQFRGPCNPSLNYECGMLIDGFDTPPAFMMTYNPVYYGSLAERFGFQKCQDMFAFWGHVDMLETLDEKLAFIAQEATRRFEINLRRINTKKFDSEVRMFLDIYNKSLVGTWGFAPLSEGEIDHMASSMKHLIVPEMTSVAEVDGKPVGAIFGLLDYNPRIKKIDGRLFPLGFLRLLWNRKAIKYVRLISTNVIPEYQRWGVGLVLLSRLAPDILAWGIEEVEFSWVLETNHLSRASLERGGAKLTKTYRIYEKEIANPSR